MEVGERKEAPKRTKLNFRSFPPNHFHPQEKPSHLHPPPLLLLNFNQQQWLASKFFFSHSFSSAPSFPQLISPVPSLFLSLVDALPLPALSARFVSFTSTSPLPVLADHICFAKTVRSRNLHLRTQGFDLWMRLHSLR